VKTYEEEEHVRKSNLADLAYTLDSHRSHLPWRSFAVLQSPDDFIGFKERVSTPVKVHDEVPRWGFVFSGQGAQWFAMGRDLARYLSYEEELEEAGTYLRSLGCGWSVSGKFVHKIGYLLGNG
jgi:acyl transferase domain-containing protein